MFTYIQKYIDIKTYLPTKWGLLVLLSSVPPKIYKADHSTYCYVGVSMHTQKCTHTYYIYIHIHILYVYVYICMYMCVCVCVYIYRERERERECVMIKLIWGIVCALKGLEVKVISLCLNLKSTKEGKIRYLTSNICITLHSRVLQPLERVEDNVDMSLRMTSW